MKLDNRKISVFKSAAIIFFCIFIFSQSSLALAANSATIFNSGLSKTAPGAGYDAISLDKAESSLISRASKIISIALSFLGIFFFVLAFYAGFIWMTAKGDQTKVQKAKDTLVDSLVGLIIVIAAYAISYFVISALQTGIISFDSSTVQTQIYL